MDKVQKRISLKTRQQISENNLRTERNIWSQVPEWDRYLDIMTDWPSVVMWLWLDSQANSLRQYNTVCVLTMVVSPKHVVAKTLEEELLRWRTITCEIVVPFAVLDWNDRLPTPLSLHRRWKHHQQDVGSHIIPLLSRRTALHGT
jgi:hypothetical protein